MLAILNYPPPKIRHLLASVLLLGAVFGAGCPSPEEDACAPACESGSTCEPLTQACIAPRLDPFEGGLPGRAVRLEMRGARAYLAMIHPTENRLLVGEARATEAPTFYTLREFSRRMPQKIALATSETTVAVAWLDADLLYRVALRRLDAPADHWQIVTTATGDRKSTRLNSSHVRISYAVFCL